MITTIIFDLDGLLTDTERLHMKAYREALASFGVELTDDEYKHIWIRDGHGIKRYVEERKLTIDPHEVFLKKHVRFKQLLRSDLQPMPYALELLEKLHGNKRLLLATSSYYENAEIIMDELNIGRYFEMVATRDSVKNLKPAPDIFLFLTDALKISPEECLVIEDAQKGIDAAHAAGMKSIAVPNIYTKENDFSRANRIIENLGQVDLSFIDSLM